jgi:hypothetical protein
MTTCAISECRNEGVLLLHIRHRKENLLQAEYCPEHFCRLAQQWIEDIQLANSTKTRILRLDFNHFRTVNQSIADALPYIWRLKDSAPKGTPIESICEKHDIDQHSLEEIISKRQIVDEEGITHPIVFDNRFMDTGVL